MENKLVKNKKILLICNSSNSVINFRKELILFLKAKGFDVSIIFSDNERSNEIKRLTSSCYFIPFSNRSLNIFASFLAALKIKNIIKKVKPDIVFSFQVKPIILGVKVAYDCDITDIYCMIEGLGDPFQPTNIKGRLIRSAVIFLYKKTLRYAKKIFVLNKDDRNELIERKMAEPQSLVVIPGIGIDCSFYQPTKCFPSQKNVTVLARLIKNKGIIDFCHIARKVHKIRPDISFNLYGEECQITKDDLLPYIDEGSIFFGGYNKNSIEIISNSRIIVSTSYREGFPRVILEAMALERPVVATNSIGNRDAVVDGVTGFLLPIHDIDAFALKIIEIIDQEDLLIKLGKNAREICLKKYDSKIINSTILDVINKYN